MSERAGLAVVPDPAPAAQAGGPDPRAFAAALPAARRRRRPDWALFLSFAALVLLPGCVVGVYYALVAADQYVVSARFTVRELRPSPLSLETPERARATPVATMGEDEVSSFTHVAASYLESRALLRDLGEEIDVAAMFRVAQADPWARLPREASAEARYDYWRDRLRVSIDRTSGIVTLELRAFRPEDARRLAEAMLARAEALVNALSLRQKRDALARARAEAAESDRRLDEAIAALSAFRDGAGVLDPAREADETVRLLASLSAERIRLQSRLRVLSEVMDRDAARARELRTRLATLRGDIARLRDSLAADATADANLAGALGRYEALEIRRRFAARLYEVAQTRRIAAEIDLARQSIFLNVFDPPQLPEESRYPRRAAFTAITVLALAVGWAVLALVWASVADHRMDRRG
jgi:capsular polysaccharide transport system permease protein